MIFKLLDPSKSSKDSDPRQGSIKAPEPDPKLLERLARQQREDQKGVLEARSRLTLSYQAFLTQLNNTYRMKSAQQRTRIESTYEMWAAFFELLKQQFKETWDFFGVVQEDVEGWHRVAPAGDQTSYISVGREGYSFAAGIEMNTKRGAPFPKKWLVVSLAHSTSYLAGIGDERLVGRPDTPDENLVGLARCTARDTDAQEAGAEELRRRILNSPLVFTLSSAERGQHMTSLPISALEKHTLTEMCQKLLIALTHDDLKPLHQLLPHAEPLPLLK